LSFVIALLRESYEEWRDDRALRLGAGLAYYGVLAIVPLLILAVVMAGMVFSEQEIEEYVLSFLDSTLADEFEKISSSLATETKADSTRGGLGLLGLVSLVIAASFLFLALEDALKVIWHEPVRPGFRNSLKRRALAILVALLAGSLLLASLTLTTVLGVASRIAPDTYVVETATQAVINVAIWALAVGFLAVLVQVLVRDRISWTALFIGAAITAVVLSIGTDIAWSFVQASANKSLTGVASGIILGLVWIYYIAQMFIAGAEFTKVLDRRLSPAQGVEDS
jgi:membrane protein